MQQFPQQVTDWLSTVLSRTKDHAVVFLSVEGELTAWLGAAERLFGHAQGEALGQPYELLFVPEDRDLALHTQEIDVARCLGRSEDDRWHLRRDGSRFWGSGVLESVVAADGTLLGYCKIVRDRTDARMQLQGLQNVVEAQAAEREHHGDGLARLLHEMRNTVGPALNAVRVLQRSDDEATRRQACDVLDRQMDVMKRLLDDGLDAWMRDAVPDGPQARAGFQPMVLQQALQLAADAVRPQATQRGQALQVVLPAVPITLRADAARVHQMVVNLLVNAIKYTPEGGHVSLTGTVEASTVVIRVEDDGIGIAPEVLPHVFELFTREDRAAGSAAGLGVGLAVVREYASLHGGSVDARSPGIGKGTVVAVRLPLAPTGSRGSGTLQQEDGPGAG